MKLAIVSTLFNYPSRGGGIADTVYLGQALRRHGVEVTHLYARNTGWPTGQVSGEPPLPGRAVDFWDRASFSAGMRTAVDTASPDAVLVTDSWSSKALLARCMEGYRTFLRFHAYELVCPANNLRCVAGPAGSEDCPQNALRTPDACRQCVCRTLLAPGGRSLHACDARLAGAGEAGYYPEMTSALESAEALFVNNRLAVGWLGSYGQKAVVAGSGVDPARFAEETPAAAGASNGNGLDGGSGPVVFMAGDAEDGIKGYDVLLAACGHLWAEGLDFTLWATAQRPAVIAGGRIRLTGWLGPEELVRHYRAADICVVPSVVHESFGIVAVEAMASGKPVIASRVGGLQEIVVDGETGLLFERGDSRALAAALRQLLLDPQRREQMGRAARRRAMERYTWDAVVERAYLPVLMREPAAAGSKRLVRPRAA